MRTKPEIIQQLRAAKAAHVVWRTHARALVCGFEIDPQTVPVLHTDSKFGQWYYTNGQKLSSLHGYAEIESSLILIHNSYMQIHKLAFGKVKWSLFSSKKKEEN